MDQGIPLEQLDLEYIQQAAWGHYDTVKQPCLCLAGTDDAAFLAGIENLFVTLPNAEMAYIQGVGHGLQRDAPNKYRQLTCDFIEKNCLN